MDTAFCRCRDWSNAGGSRHVLTFSAERGPRPAAGGNLPTREQTTKAFGRCDVEAALPEWLPRTRRIEVGVQPCDRRERWGIAVDTPVLAGAFESPAIDAADRMGHGETPSGGFAPGMAGVRVAPQDFGGSEQRGGLR